MTFTLDVELEPRWAQLAHATPRTPTSKERATPANVIEGDARQAARLLNDARRRQIDLIVTSPP